VSSLQRAIGHTSKRRPGLHLRRTRVIAACVAILGLRAAPTAASTNDAARHITARDTVEVTLTAAPARLSLIPGATTDVYAYNGQVPGPTLELREGDHLVVRFRNELPEPTTVHWHGIHLPFTADGSPFHPVPPGGEHVYAFTVAHGTAGTYWYHPHPHASTARQLGRGLFGVLIVRADDDPLPEAIDERVLVLWDNRFGPDGSIDFPRPGSRQARIDDENGREGDVVFVNGEILPSISMRSGEVQRWRIINASAARTYRLALSGHTFLHVGSYGGLFERPREVDEILLANSERAELLVRGTGEPGARAVLQALPHDRYPPRTRPPDAQRIRDLAVIHYDDAPRMQPPEIPSSLRPVPALDSGTAAVTRTFRLSRNRINSRQLDMNRIDEVAALGSTEVWEIANLVGMDHPFHLHGFRFQVLERNGEPEPDPTWKDTVNVPRFSSVRIVVRFEDHAGLWMFHCHILDHEDNGMMGILEVR
jgi:FtsP/CotA-like multicopper oxidase with cupredoxin domain